VSTIRPTKKQQELLNFIEEFIADHGYSPSYREIMSGCSYTSVATVALHVNNLIKRGHIIKRDNEARSLEVVNSTDNLTTQNSTSSDFIKKVEAAFSSVETTKKISGEQIDELFVLVGALTILNYPQAATYNQRLQKLQ
jgi:SOS-response transcriptional repressor LexA